nr:MAG TPA: hypothetical protein [Caudoviricetes sp.]
MRPCRLDRPRHRQARGRQEVDRGGHGPDRL